MNNKEIDIIFLAGGYGSRMGETGKTTQKCMIPFQGKPVLQHLLEQATKAFGSFRPIIAVSHRKEDVMDYFGSTWNNNEIVYIEDPGGVEDIGVLAIAKGVVRRGRPFLVVHGNIIFDSSLFTNVAEMQAKEAPLATLSGAIKLDESNHAVIRIDGDRVSDIIIPQPSNIPQGYLRDMGLNGYDDKIFEFLETRRGSSRYGLTAIAEGLKAGYPVSGVMYPGEWIHFEKPKDFDRIGWKL